MSFSTTIQPEIQELKEGGYIQRARDELMKVERLKTR